MTSPVTSAVGSLPGVVLPGRVAGELPRLLLASGPHLLRGARPGVPVGLSDHRQIWGPQPRRTLAELVVDAAAAGVVGAGGAAFPTDRKLAAMAGRHVGHVVVNGAEGESASGKDGVLLGYVPHMVLDGAVAAARAVGCLRVVVRVAADRQDLVRCLPRAISQRHDEVGIELSVGPAQFAAGEASAVARAVAGGPALPADLGRPPVLPGGRPWRRRTVLVSNAETFARLAVASRGILRTSALASASGAVGRPGVVELDDSSDLGELAAAAGGVVGRPRLLIAGGWHGRWMRWDARTATTRLDRGSLARAGGRWGAGAFVWVPGDVDPMAAVAAVAGELAAGSAGQCGPCWRGLPELARALGAEAAGRGMPGRVESLLGHVDGRGTCSHPSASVTALRSALALVAESR